MTKNSNLQIDIDDELLKVYGPRTQPLNADFLKRRDRPLIVDIYKGDISLKHESLLKADAIIGIEVIEHLFPETLENLPFTIFGYAKPKLVILTTPNCEYNVYFKGMVGFRHDDHKFEWTRQEFEDWAGNLCVRYPEYTVKFVGIAPSPADCENRGCVSQMAVFIRKDFFNNLPNNCCDSGNEITDKELLPPENYYTLVYSYNYPENKDTRTVSQRILDEVTYHLRRFQNMEEQYMNDEGLLQIPMREILNSVFRETDDMDTLTRVLQDASYKIVGDDLILDRFSDNETSSEEEYYDKVGDTSHDQSYENETVEEDWN